VACEEFDEFGYALAFCAACVVSWFELRVVSQLREQVCAHDEWHNAAPGCNGGLMLRERFAFMSMVVVVVIVTTTITDTTTTATITNPIPTTTIIVSTTSII